MAFFRHSGTGVVFGERYWRVKLYIVNLFYFCLEFDKKLTRQYRSPNTTPVPLCPKKDIFGFSQ